MTERHTVRIACYMFIFINNKLLLMQRQNSGFDDGLYTAPSGHIEPLETPAECAIRETKEELGITVLKYDFSSVIHRCTTITEKNIGDSDYVDFFFICNEFIGTPKNMEPEKCAEVKCFELDNLPEMVPQVKMALLNRYIGNKKLLNIVH